MICENVPASHARQAVVPPNGWYSPGAQGRQDVLLVAPVAGMRVPGWQGVGRTVPASQK